MHGHRRVAIDPQCRDGPRLAVTNQAEIDCLPQTRSAVKMFGDPHELSCILRTQTVFEADFGTFCVLLFIGVDNAELLDLWGGGVRHSTRRFP